MKKKLLGVKRQNILFDFDLYRTRVPIPGVANAYLSVLDLWPEGAQQTILFVHGYAGVLESWEFQINHFARNYRVVAPDLRGHGQSDAPYTQYTMPELVGDLQAIAEELKLPEKFILVAHSFGGSIAVEYANAHPERLDKLVLIATAGEFPLPKLADYLLRVPASIIQPLWPYRNRWDAEFHVVKRMMANNLRHWQGWHLLRSITTPTLVITGERDSYFPRQVFEEVGKTIPNAEVYDVGSAKHKVQLERHQAVNRAIERFIGGDRTRSWRDDGAAMSVLTDRVWISHYDPETPPTLPIPRRPLTDFLESAAGWLPRRTAVIFYGQSLTYAQLNQKVNQFAHVLHGLGVTPGDRVMVVLPNMPQIVIAFYAILRIGAVVVMPNPDADATRIVQQARDTQAKVFITLTSLALLARLVHDQIGLERFVFADIRQVISPTLYQRLMARWQIVDNEKRDSALVQRLGARMSSLMQDAPVTPPDIRVEPGALAAILFTSGTTDEPRGVCLSHANLVANTLQTRHWLPELKFGEEVCLAVTPIVHSYGMTSGMNVPIALGATLVLLPVFDIEQVLEHIKAHKPSIFPGVPSMYTLINQTRNVREYGLSSIKACVSGSAPLPVEVQEAFEKLTRGRLVEGYGLTEASPVTHANPLRGVRKAGSIGVPLPNTEAKIVDLHSGADLGPGGIGELMVRGPQVMQGYWQPQGEPDRSTIRDGWLATGDVAVRDSEGYFRIISRKKDAIVMGDYTVYPRDVEEVLYENNKVLEVAVVGVGSAESGHPSIKAFVVARPGSQLTGEELLDLARRRLAAYAIPAEIEFRDELPKSFIGKVLRRLLTQPGGRETETPDETSN